MNSIEAYIQFKPGLITDDGEVTDPSTEEFLRDYMMQFHGFITRVYTALPDRSQFLPERARRLHSHSAGYRAASRRQEPAPARSG